MENLTFAIEQGIAPAIIVAIYLIIVKLIDNKKASEQAKLNKSLTDSINNISDFIITITKDVIKRDVDKCKSAIEDSMYSTGMRLTNFIATTIVHNHIDLNKSTIVANIHNIVNAEFYTIQSTLSLYKVNTGSNNASDFMKQEWMKEIENDMIDIIYNTDLSKEEKIVSFANKITIKFQTYTTYITNHITD